MRTTVLISRIARLVETVGEAGDGARLAEEYAQAVRKANARLEAVSAAADAQNMSEAIRLLSEDPPLLEEVNVLDFFQLEDWMNLCDMNGWTLPPKIDKQMAERALAIDEAKGAIAPFLALYKKAVRVNNVRLAVKSLRRLVDLDTSQDWSRNLKQSERQLQALIVSEFQKAQTAGDEEACDRLVQELLDANWRDGVTAAGSDTLRAYRAKREAERREQTGHENVAILKKCRDEKWDRKLALTLVSAVDDLAAQGWTLPKDARPIVEDCRARCARELEKEEADARWRDVNEALHAAIQQEDCEAIRAALSAPEFLDRDPDGGMLQQAQDVLAHDEAARRRKTRQIAVCACLSVLAVLGVSVWWLRQGLFERRCAETAAALSASAKLADTKPQTAIASLSAELSRLRTDQPDVLAHPRVAPFQARLKEIVSRNCARTNQVERLLRGLEAWCAAAEPKDAEAESVVERLEQVSSRLMQEDDDYRVRYLNVKNAWLDYDAERKRLARERATKFHATLVSHLAVVTDRLTKELARDELEKEVADCKASIQEWRTVHGKVVAELDAKLLECEKSFNEAVEIQRLYKESLERLSSAKDAGTMCEARQTLIRDCGNFPEVKHLKRLDVTTSEIRDVLSSEPSMIASYLKDLKGGVTDEAFDSFLKENVQVIADAPAYYSLYALMQKGDTSKKIIAVSKGKPKIERPSYETSWKVSSANGLLEFRRHESAREMKSKAPLCEPFLMPSSDEMKTVVEIAQRSKLSVAAFENELLKLIGRHIEVGHQLGFLEDEKKKATLYNPVRGWMSPFRRVQFVAWYMRWLREDLNLMPKDPALMRWCNEFDRMAENVQVDGVDESLAWLSVWDDRVRRRMKQCAKLLHDIPADWVRRYRAGKKANGVLSEISGWKVQFAGKVQFDPFEPDFKKKPDALVVSASHAAMDHPLYALRHVNGRLTLVRAFEPGKTTWRKCKEMEQMKEEYALGEPLYHVFAKGKFIDVQEALKEMAERIGGATAVDLPLFGKGGR